MVLTVNGIDLHWTETGGGEPLLFLHGAMGHGGDWRHIFTAPPAGYRVIAPDLRGHGATANPSGEFTFRQCAHDVLALLRHLGIARVKAIGVSGGGIVLLHMATIAPSQIASMILVSAPPYFPAEARAVMRQFSEAAMSETERARLREVHVHGEAQITQLFAMSRDFADSYDDVSFTPPYLATISADTLIVFGDRDFLYPVSLAFELHRGIPRSRLWVVPNGGHGPVFGDAAPRFVSAALEFLSGATEGTEGTLLQTEKQSNGE
jgi:pimeloyl-ACP methyl ester carboxylesterase